MDTALMVVLNCSGLTISLLVGYKKLKKVQLFNGNAQEIETTSKSYWKLE